MRKATAFLFTILFCTAVVVQAPADDDGSSPNEEWWSAYWAQFSTDHVTENPVADRLVSVDLLLDAVFADRHYALSWDAVSETVLVDVDVESVDDLLMVNGDGERPVWEAAFDEDGLPQLSGFVDVDEVNDLVVLELTIGEESYRMFSAEVYGEGALDGGSLPPVPPQPYKCVCFGIGTATKTCTNDDCDTSEDCGTGSKVCRWKSGM